MTLLKIGIETPIRLIQRSCTEFKLLNILTFSKRNWFTLDSFVRSWIVVRDQKFFPSIHPFPGNNEYSPLEELHPIRSYIDQSDIMRLIINRKRRRWSVDPCSTPSLRPELRTRYLCVIYAAPMPRNTRMYAGARVLRCISCSRAETSSPPFYYAVCVCVRARSCLCTQVCARKRNQHQIRDLDPSMTGTRYPRW